MSLFSGLEKFGLKSAQSMKLFEDEEKEEKKGGSAQAEEKIPVEADFILERTVKCKVCEHTFKTKAIKSGRVKRLDPDRDLRPRFQYVDTLKYDITSCPQCGYTALSRYFDNLTPVQTKLIKEQISSNFRPAGNAEGAEYTYDEAIDRYKLSLINTVVKKGKDSEKAYTCLKIAWLLRGKAENMPESTPEEKAAKAGCRKEEEEFYQQAYEGFMKAIGKEMFPMCGMDESTVDYLLAYMSFHFKKYEVASKFLAGVMNSASANRRMKDKALELKQDILGELRK